MIGQAIAHYQITAKLGEGGMGEVYRAMDTKLGREVALKILPAAFASDADRMARFEREAKLLASLNHPNIAQVYGVEEHALVMELVEGESPKGPLPFEDAWKIASQIASALEYAHEKGIVHRDLKPANVKVTPDGVVKLLDFGLAKAFTASPEASNQDNSPTLTLGATQVGVILGTAAYMSPEQARGKNVDKRTDIWAFGVVLYELLTGERLFKGDEVADTLAKVLTREPDLERVPPQARRLLRRCLEKDPKRRLRDIGESQYLLEDAAEQPEAQLAAAAPAPRHRRLPWIVATTVATAGALALIPGNFFYFRKAPPARHVQRYTITAPENTTNLHSFAISPDGNLIAMAAEVKGKRQLWLRALDSLQVRPVAGTDEALYPFWSPDSRYIGFFAQGKLKKIAAGGGPAQSLCEVSIGRGGSWNRDNVIVFAPSLTGVVIRRVSATGGVPSDVIKATRGYSSFPVFLPDGRHFLYRFRGESADQNGIYLSSLDGTENRLVMPDVSSAVFASGRMLFVRESTLMAQPFDSINGQATGEVFPVTEGISTTPVFGYAPVTVSETGLLLYESGDEVSRNQLAWYDRGGKLLGTVGSPSFVFDPTISPDEKSILFRRRSEMPPQDLWLWDLSRRTEQRLTTGASINTTPFWSPKGDRMVFASNRSGIFDLYQKSTSGTGKEELLVASENLKQPTQWSHDGRFIVYSETDPKTGRDIWVLPMDGVTKRKPVPFLRSEFSEYQGQLSPDSHWMAYTSDESGQPEVYVRPFPDGEGQTKISIAGGEQPRWRGDGKELFFVAADGKMMAVAVKATAGPRPSFEPGVPEVLFQTKLARPTNPLFEYDVTADGKRFLLDTVAGGLMSAPPLTVEVNWDAGLKK
jgi:serine/threonine protein kinase/Tol biopolymer transport system component